MNAIELVRDVAAKNQLLLDTNTNATCFAFISLVLKELAERGYPGWGYIGKTAGEGQYQPPTGFPRQAGPHMLTGVSHDAIGSPTQRVDLLGSGNDGDKPIYHKATEPFWSYDPADGSRIKAQPSWTEIPPEHWRANNPIVSYPLSSGTGVPVAPHDMTKPYPGDAYFVDSIGKLLEADYAKAKQVLNAGSATWFARTIWRHVNENMSMADSLKKSQVEWRQALDPAGTVSWN